MDFAPTQHSRFSLQGQNQIPSAVQLHPALQQHLMAGYMPQQMQPMQPQGGFQGGMQKGMPRGNQMGTASSFPASAGTNRATFTAQDVNADSVLSS